MGCETANSNKASVSVPANDSDDLFDLVICMSGKRKSGKDYVAIKLAEALLTGGGGNMRVAICGISHPLKEEYAKLHGLDVEKLKSDSEYKELHRAEMVRG
jgi:phosphomevalonate kinase